MERYGRLVRDAMTRKEAPTLIAHHAIQTISHSLLEGSIE